MYIYIYVYIYVYMESRISRRTRRESGTASSATALERVTAVRHASMRTSSCCALPAVHARV
jgi:hypothetical protein